jgi:hypothetical protein
VIHSANLPSRFIRCAATAHRTSENAPPGSAHCGKGRPLPWFLLLALGAFFPAHAQKAPTALDFSALAPVSGEWKGITLADNLTAAETGLLRGERGLALAPGKHADFDLTVRLRLDDLRYQIRLPQAGVAFAAAGPRDYAGVLFERNSGRLQVIRVVANKAATLATSDHHAILPLKHWIWLRVVRHASALTASLSFDGISFEDYIRVALPADLGSGQLGLVGDLPAATFGPALPPPLVVRNLGEWTQSLTGAVVARYSVERFAASTGLTREPLSLTFPAGATSATLPAPFAREISNPALVSSPEATKTFRTNETVLAASDPVPTADDYRRTFASVAALIPRRDGYVQLGNAFAYDATRDNSLRAALTSDARNLLDSFSRDQRTPTGFAELYAAHRVLASAKRDRLLPDADLAGIRDFARQSLLRAAYERGPMNRAIGLLAAIRPGLSLAEGHPRVQELQTVARSIEADLAAHSFEPLEDSTNYQLISVFFIFCWAHDAERAEVLRDPRFRAVFERFLIQLGPDGGLPVYGDDYESHPGMLVGLLEAAAREFRDGRYRTAAARVYDRHFASRKLPPNLVGEDALGLGLALAQVDETLAPAPLSPPLDPILSLADGSPSKAILTAGSGASELQVVLDLANAREHGHHDALALVRLTVGGPSLLPDAGRYARSTEFHNRPLVTDDPADFPHRRDTKEQSRRMIDDTLSLSTWHRLSFSLRQNWIWGNFAGALGLPALEREQYHPDIGPEFAFDPAHQSVLLLALAGVGPVTVEIRSTRLVGPAGIRELTDLPVRFDLTLGPDTAYRGAVLPDALDLKSGAFQQLEFELRLTPATSNSQVELNSVVIGDADGYPKRFLAADSPAETVRVLFARNSPAGSVAGFETVTATPAGQSVRLTRLIAVLPERGVWVRDQFDALGTGSVTVGPVWRFAAAHLAPDGWLHAPGLRLGFAPTTGSTITLSSLQRFGIDTPLAFGASTPLPPGASVVHDAFLAPAACGRAPATWAVKDGVLLLDGHPAAVHRILKTIPNLEILP